MPPFFINSNYIVYIFFLTFLSQGQLITGLTKAWLGGFGEIGKPYSYTHPSTKQCNYEAASIPSGVITMWSGTSTNIPEGWLLCNGSNGTPDLRDRFIVGAGNEYSVSDTGGEKTHTLTVDELPSHTHTFTGIAHNHSFSGSVSISAVTSVSTDTRNFNYNSPSTKGVTSVTASKSSSNGTVSGTTGNATATGTNSDIGGGQAHENRPPYYALCFIMKS